MEFEYVSGKIIFERYEIIDILGKGGIGITYAAIDLKTKEKVALKAVSLQQLKDWKQVELLEREASVLAQLNHPAIPKYLDYFQIDSEDERIFYIVQELAPGKSLFQLVESGWRTNETEIKKITIQILNIFSYLHSLNPPVIHRDIKPHNLILGDDGKIFLVDFGAVQNTYYNTLMQGSTVVGTYGYMAPEQFKGKAKPATDLYGLGATILYLLTHRSPNELPQDTLKIDFRDSVNISEGFAIWLEKILQPDLEERFSSAKEALEKLSDRYLFTKAFTNKWKVVFNLGLVGAIALTFNSYKWGFLSRLGYYPSELCRYSDVMKNYIETGGNLNITLLEDPKFAGDNSPKIQTNLWRCILNEHPDKHTKEIVELLIAKGADINAKDKDGRIPLFWAVINHQYEVAELLIAKGADVNSRDNFGSTPLIWAMSPEDEEGRKTLLTAKLSTAKLLITKGANINARGNIGITPLHQAARNHRREVVEFLISKGANVNARDNNGLTPLSSAAGNHNHEVIELLIAKGADVNARDNYGKTPLLWAVNEARNNSKSELFTVELLIYQGADVNAKDKDGKTALFENSHNLDIAKLLIDRGADVNAKDKDGKTALFENSHNLDMTKLLIDKGADVNVKDNDGKTALLKNLSKLEIAKLLIAKGADVNVIKDNGSIFLFEAISNRDREKVNFLVEKGVDINAKDKDGNTVLFKAVDNRDEKIIRLLVAKNAEINAKNNDGRTPLWLTIRESQEIAKLLIDLGADVNTKDNNGKTPLFLAANNREEEVVKLLIDKGADVNAKDNDGRTPLFEAVNIISQEIVKILIDRGANVNAKDNKGITPISLLKSYKYDTENRLAIMDILKKNGAKE